jgi:hypothetical protein
MVLLDRTLGSSFRSGQTSPNRPVVASKWRGLTLRSITPATAILGEALLQAFAHSLRDRDLSPVTVRDYLHDLGRFRVWIEEGLPPAPAARRAAQSHDHQPQNPGAERSPDGRKSTGCRPETFRRLPLHSAGVNRRFCPNCGSAAICSGTVNTTWKYCVSRTSDCRSSSHLARASD